jgi:hypothetical protein
MIVNGVNVGGAKRGQSKDEYIKQCMRNKKLMYRLLMKTEGSLPMPQTLMARWLEIMQMFGSTGGHETRHFDCRIHVEIMAKIKSFAERYDLTPGGVISALCAAGMMSLEAAEEHESEERARLSMMEALKLCHLLSPADRRFAQEQLLSAGPPAQTANPQYQRQISYPSGDNE